MTSFICSSLNQLLFIIYLSIKFIEVPDKQVLVEREYRWLVTTIALLEFFIYLGPFLVHLLSFLLVLFDCVLRLVFCVHLEGLFECQRVDLLQNCLQCDQGLLQNLVPVIFSEVNDDRDEHREGFLFVRF